MRTSLTALSSAIPLFATISSAAYTIQDDYTPSNFASMFDFWTGDDPTTGYVNYISQAAAESAGLYNTDSNSVYMGVDSTNVASGRGRDSIRISSKASYNHGLILLDLAHMPGGQCGSWPAFWLLGPDWPNNGELDIIEGVNSATTNAFAGHTNARCSITSTGAFSGTLGTSNCDINAPGQGANVGCTVHTGNTQTYGAGFNAAGGGVYATEWTSEAISIWFFPRSAIPSDITSNDPNPDNWGIPIAQFTGGCDIDKHFRNQQIVFDITFCGQWAGQVWSQDAVCAPRAATCQDYVRDNPSAYADAYWRVNSLKVYQENGQSPSPSSATSSAAATSSATSAATQQTTFSTITTASSASSIPPAIIPNAPTRIASSSSYSTSYPTSYSSYFSYSNTNTYPTASSWNTYIQPPAQPTSPGTDTSTPPSASWNGWSPGQPGGRGGNRGGGVGGQGGWGGPP